MNESPAPNNRRQRGERRQFDAGPPPGLGERRQRAERRLPQLVEATLSEDEFRRYFGGAAH